MGNQPGKLQHQNHSGRPKKMVHWKSAERPSPPGRPNLIPLSDQQPDVVNLSWERPKLDGGSPITGYVVEHRRMGSPHWVRATPTPVPRCEVSISGLEPGWRYQFRAFAENIVGRSDASELSDPLTVTLQRNAITVPRFFEELQEVNAVEDERVEFRVRIIGQPTPEISWFKDGYEIFSSRRTKIVNDNDTSVLIIHQVALTDEGEIKCTATNRAGHVVTKAQLRVQAPPKIRLPRTYEDGLIVEADEVLRLKVGIAGQPPPIVTWLHEGEVIQNMGRFEIINTEKNSMLKIDTVQRDDRGEYSVRAHNKMGEDVSAFLVTVTARPNPPGKVKLNMSFGKSATLSWTAPVDDGGCKIGNYIVEYFRVGWNVWLKAATTRSLTATLNDLIEGSEYKFRVKAENPYGLSDPSEESEVLFIPDPKRGINKPKSATKLVAEDSNKPKPPRRKTLSPHKPQQDAATETMSSSPLMIKKVKPQLLDNADLHREMSYGTPDQVLKMDVRKSPSLSSADSIALNANSRLALKPDMHKVENKSPQRSPLMTDKQLTPAPVNKTPNISSLFFKQTLPATGNAMSGKDISPVSEQLHRALSQIETTKTSRSPTPSDVINSTPALQRSAEPVQLGVNQNVRRYSGQSLSPAKNAPAVAIAIATAFGSNSSANGEKIKVNKETITNPTIQINAPAPAAVTAPRTTEVVKSTTSNSDKYKEERDTDMLINEDRSVKDNTKQDSFELDLEDAIQPPKISISSPDLASLEFSNLHTFPLRRSVSSTELLYERAMARFYEAVELEEAEKARKQSKQLSQEKLSANPTTVRKRLGSMTEAERLSFEKRSEMRRMSADVISDLKSASNKWNSKENISAFARNTGLLQQESQESEDYADLQARNENPRNDSYDLGSDYTESTDASEEDSIEKFKQELLARTRSPSPRDLETYHPRDMSAGVFTPYRAPTAESAALVLTRPSPLPSPDFVPKPILKRPNFDNELQQNDSTDAAGVQAEKMDIAKGIKSFFKRDKKAANDKNTEENQTGANANGKQLVAADTLAAEVEAKRKIKAEEERKKAEAERIMLEESHAVADHYGDLVRQVSSTHKYHTPLYMNREELEKIAQKVGQADLSDAEDNDNDYKRLRARSPDIDLLKPPVSNKPRLSISEKGQMVHVRETASDLSISNKPAVNSIRRDETPSEDNAMQETTQDVANNRYNDGDIISTTVVSETVEERPDSRGRTRLVKVKRIVKKRVSSSATRSRDTSTSRPPSSMGKAQDVTTLDVEAVKQAMRRAGTAESESPAPLSRRPILPQEKPKIDSIPNELNIAAKSSEQMIEEAHENVRSAISYTTDMILFIVACYVYLFKDARLVLPILALMIYRQLGEAIMGCIPSWMRRKKN